MTEDDYIEYLGRADVADAACRSASRRALRRSHFLFLGYTMRDWSLRVVLGRMWGEAPLAYRSWAVTGAGAGRARALAPRRRRPRRVAARARTSRRSRRDALGVADEVPA